MRPLEKLNHNILNQVNDFSESSFIGLYYTRGHYITLHEQTRFNNFTYLLIYDSVTVPSSHSLQHTAQKPAISTSFIFSATCNCIYNIRENLWMVTVKSYFDFTELQRWIINNFKLFSSKLLLIWFLNLEKITEIFENQIRFKQKQTNKKRACLLKLLSIYSVCFQDFVIQLLGLHSEPRIQVLHIYLPLTQSSIGKVHLHWNINVSALTW